MQDETQKKKPRARFSPFTTGLIIGFLIGIGSTVAFVAAAVYFGA